jgi:adenine-specific DNA-methyltransferase
MPRIVADELARRWSAELGLASNPLFSPNGIDEEHYALLDGVEGSFALSAGTVERPRGVDWAWSANLGHYVFVGNDHVSVRNTSGGAIRQFDRAVVEQRLERFFEYLLKDSNKPSVDVITHIINTFRSHRYHLNSCNVDQALALPTFLLCLAHFRRTQSKTASPETSLFAIEYDLDLKSYQTAITPEYLRRFDEQLGFNAVIGRSLDLQLTIRHAAGALFQEAHAELSRGIQSQGVLWGLPTFPEIKTSDATGVYFTPPGLARTMADLALAPHLSKKSVTILDPACGSGIFLCEALRSLRRHQYAGKITLIGFDVSDNAILMARFALDESGDVRNTTRLIECRDFLTSQETRHLHDVDVVLMNPPFVNFNTLGSAQRDLMRAKLGVLFRYRPDLSVLFIYEALNNLAHGGTLASLVPVGVLSADSSAEWRRSLARDYSIDVVAVLGDHNLFKHALVNAAVLILRKTLSRPDNQSLMLWGSQHPGSGAAALRGLRRWVAGISTRSRDDDWALYSVGNRDLAERDRWLPSPNALGTLKTRLEAEIPHRIGDLFTIELGVRSGDRSRFVVDQDFINRASRGERQHFRPIAETSSIANGRISAKRWLFYPTNDMTALEIQKECPRYYDQFIRPLSYPPDQIIKLARARRRTYASSESRIVSRAFAGVGGFAVDYGSRHVVVTGYAWIPALLNFEWVNFAGRGRRFGPTARGWGSGKGAAH